MAEGNDAWRPRNVQVKGSGIQELQGTMEHGEKEPKLEAVILVSLLREMASHGSDNIQISDPNSIVKHKKYEEGLRDYQKGGISYIRCWAQQSTGIGNTIRYPRWCWVFQRERVELGRGFLRWIYLSMIIKYYLLLFIHFYLGKSCSQHFVLKGLVAPWKTPRRSVCRPGRFGLIVWRPISAFQRFGNYLLQQNKINQNLLAINQEVVVQNNQFLALKSAHLCVCGWTHGLFWPRRLHDWWRKALQIGELIFPVHQNNWVNRVV